MLIKENYKMEIIKTKKVETIEEVIQINNGIYFFSLGIRDHEPEFYYKLIIDHGDWDSGMADIFITKVKDCYDDYLILYKEIFEDRLPYLIECYFKKENDFENWYEDITEEQFEAVKEKVKTKL